jgi:WD40-like Beta Propeller Repeat
VRTKRRSERTKRVTAVSSIIFGGLLLSTSGAGVGALPTIQFEQAEALPVASNAAAVGDVVGQNPSVSGDGRYVVFQGVPRVAEGTTDSRLSTAYLTDRETGETIEITPVPAGLRSGDSVHPVISGDGCSVAAVTQMSLDVFRDNDTEDRWDVYRSILPHCGGTLGDWELVSTRPDSGGLARDDVTLASPTLTRSGTSIAYTHPADHLFGADGLTTISLVDLTVPLDDPLRSEFVGGSPADSPTDTFVHAGLDQPSISGDGRYLAYRSDATSSEAVAGWGPGPIDGAAATRQVFVWEIEQPDPFLAVHLVSATADGIPAPNGASEPDISRNGMNVAFASSSTELAPAVYPSCTTDCPSQVFVLDRDSDEDGEINANDERTVQLLSVANDVEPVTAGTAPSSQPSISADGQLVAFVTKAPNLLPIEVTSIGGGDDGDLLLAEVRRGALSRLTNRPGEVVPTPGVHAHPDLSESGRTAVFDSAAAADLFVDGALSGRQVVARSSEPSLSLANADLGTTLVSVASDEWYVAIVNDGPSSFRPTSATISNPEFTIDAKDSSCLYGSSIPAGGTCTVEVTFTPTRPGPAVGTLTVTEEGFGAVTVSSEIRGAGGNPALRISPAGADLGVVKVGETSVEYQFDLTNVSLSPAYITSFEINGEHKDEFAFATNNCAFRPVNPRASCSVGITFTPADQGRRTALVELSTGSGQYTTMLIAGDGEFEPVVELDATEVEAGRDFVATGSSYPPNTDITVVFGDGPNSSVTTKTDADGNFSVIVPVDPNERGGERRIVVQSSTGASASAPVQVIQDDTAFVGMPGFGLG